MAEPNRSIHRLRIPVMALAAVVLAVPALAVLNENCTVNVLNRTAQVRPDGSWIIPNATVRAGVSDPQTTAPAPSKDAATVAFERGVDLLERNCGECYPSTREGLADGIASLRRALELGYRDPAAVHRLLIRAYADMTFAWYREGEPEKARYRQLWRAELAELVRVDPSDLDNQLMNIRWNSGEGEKQIATLRAFVTEHPQYAPAEYELTLRLLEFGSDDEAIQHAQRWLANAKSPEARRGSVELLEGIDAERLRKMVAAAPSFHPGRYALGLRLVAEGLTNEGVRIGRTAVEDAPPAIAAEYVAQLATTLDQQNHSVESEALRKEFREKVRKGQSRRDP